MVQGHLCSAWIDGEYKRTRDLPQVKEAFEDQMKNLALAQKETPETVREHYAVLEHHGGECIKCGVCETRCPFGVSIRKNMDKAAAIFGY